MNVSFHGVRGSYPVPGPSTNKYGGNPTCISIWKVVNGKVVRVIFDAGNGIIPLGKIMVGNFFSNLENLKATICFTHLHPDHTQGFPFFAPNFFSACILHLMGMKTLKKHIGAVLEQGMLPPTFPIEYKDLKSTRNHYEVKDGQIFFINESGEPTNLLTADSVFKIQVMQAYAPSHPQQGAVYYRITDLAEGKSITCLWDLESHYGGDRRVINFARGSDAIIHDTQYTDEEYASDKMIVQGFGHSTYNMAIENAVGAGVKHLICMHYNPAHTDYFLDEFSDKLKKEEGYRIQLTFAIEGETITI